MGLSPGRTRDTMTARNSEFLHPKARVGRRAILGLPHQRLSIQRNSFGAHSKTLILPEWRGQRLPNRQHDIGRLNDAAIHGHSAAAFLWPCRNQQCGRCGSVPHTRQCVQDKLEGGLRDTTQLSCSSQLLAHPNSRVATWRTGRIRDYSLRLSHRIIQQLLPQVKVATCPGN